MTPVTASVKRLPSGYSLSAFSWALAGGQGVKNEESDFLAFFSPYLYIFMVFDTYLSYFMFIFMTSIYQYLLNVLF